MRNILSWNEKIWTFDVELQSIATQNRVARNEDKTKGANLLNIKAMVSLPLKEESMTITLSAKNLLNRRYYNHLSFYRKLEVPEPGRNFQISLNVPFKLKNN